MSGLAPAALSAWSLAWASIYALAQGVDPGVVIRADVTGAVLAAGAGLLAVVRRRGLVASTCLVVAATLASCAAYAVSVTAAPLQDVGARVTVTASIVGDYRVRAELGGPMLDVRAHAIEVTSAYGDTRVGAPIVLRTSPEDAPGIGAVVEVTGGIQEGDPLRGFAARIDVDTIEVIEAPGPLGAMANAVRGALRTSLEGAPPRAAALVEGLAVGDETAQPPDLEEQMRVAGLSHLTAVSGGNTSIVVGAVLLVATMVGLGLHVRVALAGAALGAFVVIVGPQPSVLRASVMAIIALLAIITGSRRTGLHALALAVVVLVVLSPSLAASWGFALSVAATGGLVVLAAPIAARWGGGSRVRQAVVGALALTVGAQITTLPLIAAFGDGLSLVAVPANLLAAPAVGPVTVLGLLAAVVGTVAMGPARVLAGLAEPFAAWIAFVAEATSSWPAATLPWPGGLPGALLATGVSLVLVYVIRRHRGRHERVWRPQLVAVASVIVAIVAIVALRVPERAGWPPPGWILVACDVGQGDAVVLRGDAGGIVVADAGPDPRAINQCLADLGVSHVDLLVLSHHHVDHVGGVPGVLDGRTVGAAVVSPLREPAEPATQVEAWLADVPTSAARMGEVREVGGITLTVLWPQRIIRGPESAPNNASVVLLAEVQGVRILLLGDVEVSAQVALRTSLAAPGVDVVKVAHHGSRYQDPALAAWTAGRVAIISVGEGNRYGHPAAETVSAWQQAGAIVGRTDLAGDVAIVAEPLGVITRRTG
ncbi:MAG: ComEC/Rec2 family competence protein [Candidatus Nanopelagicales bacterium]